MKKFKQISKDQDTKEFIQGLISFCIALTLCLTIAFLMTQSI